MNRGYAYRERLGPQAAGRTVLDWLSERHPHSDRVTWVARIAAGQVTLGGETASATDLLAAGESLVWHRPAWSEAQVPLAFAVLFRDRHLLAVAKPRGLPCVPNGGFLEHTLLRRVRRLFPEAVPLHRLGRGTSGLVLFALSRAARRAVAADWREGRVEKEYRALLSGRPAQDAFTVDVPIGPVPHPRLGAVHAASARGRAAVSHARVIAARGGDTLVSVTIVTGRPHQIRIHMAAAGHPLVGDPLYVAGGGTSPEPGLPGDGGYWLHAWRLALTHPATGGRLVLECVPPPVLRG
ncbi:MAG: RluA family pseudouridine synthase [Betaproteobacteria bacterium]